MAIHYDFYTPAESQDESENWEIFKRFSVAQTYPKGQVLYHQDEEANCFYYLISGRVKTYISSEDGNEHILTTYQSGDILGEAAFFTEGMRFSSAKTLSTSVICSIDRNCLNMVVASDSSVMYKLLRYLSKTVRMLSRHVDTQTFLPADKRIVRYMLSLAAESGSLSIATTQEEIGNAIDASRVTVSRTLKTLEAEELIRCGYREINLLDKNKLTDYLQRNTE